MSDKNEMKWNGMERSAYVHSNNNHFSLGKWNHHGKLTGFDIYMRIHSDTLSTVKYDHIQYL